MSTPPASLSQASRDQNIKAGGMHLGALILGLLTGLSVVGGALLAIVVWFATRHRNAFLAAHAATLFNFCISMLAYITAATFGLAMLMLIMTFDVSDGGVMSVFKLMVPAFLLTGPIGALIWLVATIFGAGFRGRPFRYPLAIKMLPA